MYTRSAKTRRVRGKLIRQVIKRWGIREVAGGGAVERNEKGGVVMGKLSRGGGLGR